MEENICRICLKKDESVLINIFEIHVQEDDQVTEPTLAHIIESCSRYKVEKDDNLPKGICENCNTEARAAFNFKEKTEQSYRYLYDLYYKKDDNATEILIDNSYVLKALEKHTQTENVVDEHDYEFDKKNKTQKAKEKIIIEQELYNHNCPVCDREFSRKHHVVRHLTTVHKCDPESFPETMKKPSDYKKVFGTFCPICKRSFTRKDHIIRHIKNVHKEDPKSYFFTTAGEKNESEEGPFDCVAVIDESCWNENGDFPQKNPITIDSEEEADKNPEILSSFSVNGKTIKEEPDEDLNKTKVSMGLENLVVKIELGNYDDVEFGDTKQNVASIPDLSPSEDDGENQTSLEKESLVKVEKPSAVKIFAEQTAPIARRLCRYDDDPEMKTCQLCQRVFSRLCHLRRHMQSAHTQEKPHSCPHCDKRFTRSDHLKNHVMGVHAVKSHKCDMCEKAFTRNEALQRHKEARHGDATGTYKIHECEFCKRKFTGKRYLARHRLLHTDRIYACRFCEETFKDRKLFREHERQHSATQRNFLCSICGDSFVRNDYLRIHMRRHLGEKPYKCQYCGKGFPRATDVKVHERYHTNTKPSVCQVCGKAFHRAYNLTIHMRIHTGEKPYKCDHCPKSFAQSNDLKAHIRRHTGERYKCQECDASFLQLYGLRQHALAQHGTQIESSTGRLQKMCSVTTPTSAVIATLTAPKTEKLNILDYIPTETQNSNTTPNNDSLQQHSMHMINEQTNLQTQMQPPVLAAPAPLLYPSVPPMDALRAQDEFIRIRQN